MKKRGLVVHQVGEEIEEEWRKEIGRLYPSIRGHTVPAEMFDRVRELLDEYRTATGKEAGR